LKRARSISSDVLQTTAVILGPVPRICCRLPALAAAITHPQTLTDPRVKPEDDVVPVGPPVTFLQTSSVILGPVPRTCCRLPALAAAITHPQTLTDPRVKPEDDVVPVGPPATFLQTSSVIVGPVPRIYCRLPALAAAIQPTRKRRKILGTNPRMTASL